MPTNLFLMGMNRKHLGAINKLARLHSDRLPGNGAGTTYSVHSGPGEADKRKAEARDNAQRRLGVSEYAEREARAKEVKHCVMPLLKSNYIVVTDPSLIAQMGKKVV
jgi:hypothetical protein